MSVGKKEPVWHYFSDRLQSAFQYRVRGHQKESVWQKIHFLLAPSLSGTRFEGCNASDIRGRRTLKGAPEAEAALCFCAAFCVATIHLPASVQLPSLAGSVGFDYLDLQTSQRA